jgi:hypothetical protein
MTDSEKIRKLTNAVTTAKAQFEHYAELHDRKGTPESTEKATVNRELAKTMGDALAETGSPS